MRSYTHSLRLAIAAALCLAFSWTAHAADAYMKIEGAKQGQFKGEGSRQGSGQWIPVFAVDRSAQAPASGQASGKRQHQVIRVTKEWDAASPQLQKALEAKEQLKQVVIEFVRRDLQGKEVVSETITLTDAVIADIKTLHETGKNGKASEEISFTYEKIQMTHGPAQNTERTNQK